MAVEVGIITEVSVTWKKEIVDKGPDFYARMTPKIKTKIRMDPDAERKIQDECNKTVKKKFDGITITTKR